MLFSIVIPTYNRAGFIGKAIQSVLAQTYPHYEIIVVDDGSTDHTNEVVQGLADDRIRYYKKENGERAAARNYGTLRATGNYITFLDSDDILYPSYLQNAVESIGRYQQPPFLHLAYEVTNEQLQPKVKINTLASDDISIFIKGNPLSCMGVFLKQEIARTFLFTEDRNLAGSEDWELWIRVAANVGIKTDNRISAALIDHDSRSVQQYKEEKLVQRKELALLYAFQDTAVQRKFGSVWRKITSYWDSYIALHLVLSRKYASGFRFWLQSVRNHPFSTFERRTLAIFKHILLGMFSK